MAQTDSTSMREHDDNDKKPKSRRPPNTAFRQQRLKAWQPILTPKTVLPLFFAVGIIFAPIGGLLLWTSAKVQEISIDYSDCRAQAPLCGDNNFNGQAPIPSDKVSQYFKTSNENNQQPYWCKVENVPVHYGDQNKINYTVPTTQCNIQFHIPEDLQPPILLYYHLTKFYQNHRRYVKSFDKDQLAGKYRSASNINGSDCDPLKGEVAEDGNFKPYYPCGLIANSLFNDTFSNLQSLTSTLGGPYYNMTTNETAWSSDADLYGTTAYKTSDVLPPPNWRLRYPVYNDSFPFPLLHTDENFQVWMRTAGLPSFSKLALRNDTATLYTGTYRITVDDYFPVTEYGGTKSILLSTRTVMGGRNPFLGIAYVVVGGLCVLLGALFTVTQLIRPRKLGDHSYLSWNTDQPSTATTTGRAPRTNEAA